MFRKNSERIGAKRETARRTRDCDELLLFQVGATGFGPATSASRTQQPSAAKQRNLLGETQLPDDGCPSEPEIDKKTAELVALLASLDPQQRDALLPLTRSIIGYQVPTQRPTRIERFGWMCFIAMLEGGGV